MGDDNSQLSQELLRNRLAAILSRRPECTTSDNEEHAIPPRAIGPVLDDYSAEYGITILDDGQYEQLENITSNMADDQLINLDTLLNFIAAFTVASPSGSPMPQRGSPEQVSMEEVVERGRDDERPHGVQSRSSSNDSVVTSIYRPEGGRRSRPPSVPSTPGGAPYANMPYNTSPFDSQQRQRTVPLTTAPPSAFNKKPTAPYRRRKSDGGSGGYSDGESTTDPTFGPRARRRPSNPVSPPSTSPPQDTSFGARSPPVVTPENSFTFPSTRPREFRRSPSGHQSDGSFEQDDIGNDSITSVDMMLASQSFMSEDESDSELETASMKDMMIRSHVPSDASVSGPEERLEALQRTNAELSRKLKDNDRVLLARLQEREMEIEDLQIRLEEMKTELTACKKEEKELRQKERLTGVQLSNFEQDISKLQKSLDTSKQSYQSMLKQYNEQCAESEKYRNALRHKDSQIADADKLVADRMNEVAKVKGERDILESTITSLREELDITQSAQQELDEQKHENLLLKETIDRLRYDMDALRTEATAAKNGGNSRPGTLTKSLANELKGNLSSKRREREEEEVEHSVFGDMSMETTTEGDEGQELDEDYVETIITTSRRRKVGLRAGNGSSSFIHVDDVKEYADATTQHEMSEFTGVSGMQTDPAPLPPVKASMDIQTEPEPVPPIRITASIEIQTDAPPEPEPEVKEEEEDTQPEAGPSTLRVLAVPIAKEEEDLSSSVETVRPHSPLHVDSPPSYDNVAESERHKLLQKWHPGLHGSGGVRGGVSSNVLREWANVKKELGFECVAIERSLQASTINGERPKVEAEDDDLEEEVIGAVRRPGSRIYNVYNTFMLGNGADAGGGDGSASRWWRDLRMALVGAGVLLAAYAIPTVVERSTTDYQHYLANSVVRAGTDGPQGAGYSPTYDAFWVVAERVFWTGLNAARRAPVIPT